MVARTTLYILSSPWLEAAARWVCESLPEIDQAAVRPDNDAVPIRLVPMVAKNTQSAAIVRTVCVVG